MFLVSCHIALIQTKFRLSEIQHSEIIAVQILFLAHGNVKKGVRCGDRVGRVVGQQFVVQLCDPFGDSLLLEIDLLLSLKHGVGKQAISLLRIGAFAKDAARLFPLAKLHVDLRQETDIVIIIGIRLMQLPHMSGGQIEIVSALGLRHVLIFADQEFGTGAAVKK